MKAEISLLGSVFYDYDVRFNYSKDDYISALLINDYKAYVLSNKKRINRYECAIKEYLNNRDFNNYIHLNKEEITYYITDTQFYLINKYNEYLSINEDSKWI